MSIIYTEHLPLSSYNLNDIMRYCNAKPGNRQLEALFESCADQIGTKFSNRICWCEFDVSICDDKLDLGFTKTESLLLKNYLSDCKKIILFAATIGIEIDRLIMKYSSYLSSRAVMFQAIGTERIETLCDDFEAKLKYGGRIIKPRVSPGYGDIPLELQKDIFLTLGCSKNIGLTLNDSLLMSPTKSVTAIIGIKNS